MFSTKNGRNCIERRVHRNGVVFCDAAIALMKKYRVQIDERIHRLQVMRFFKPALKRGLMIGKSPMRRAVVFGFEPCAEAQVQVFKPGDGFYVERT